MYNLILQILYTLVSLKQMNTWKEINKNNYLTLVPTNQSNEIIKKLKNFRIKLEI